MSRFLCLLVFLSPVPAAEIIVAAASDLTVVQDALPAAFRKATGYEMKFSFGSSGMLARQVANGAPYDVYLSANQQYVDELVKSGQVEAASVVWYASGRLALWSPGGSLRTLADLDTPGILHVALANPAHAPYGVAAQQALESQGLWEKLKDKLVFAENVRQAWEYARSGNADVTLTAWTLVNDKGGVLVPSEWHKPIRQVGGIVKGSAHADIARRFLQFLQSPQGRAILRQHGLFPPK